MPAALDCKERFLLEVALMHSELMIIVPPPLLHGVRPMAACFTRKENSRSSEDRANGGNKRSGANGRICMGGSRLAGMLLYIEREVVCASIATVCPRLSRSGLPLTADMLTAG